MKRSIPYSVVFLFAFLLNRIAVSARQISPLESIRPLSVLFALLGVLVFIIHKFVREWHRTNYLTALILGAFFLYQTLYQWIKQVSIERSNTAGLLLIPFVIGICMLLAGRKWWNLVHEPAQITYYLSLVAVIFLTMQVVQFGFKFQGIWMSGSTSHTSAIAPLVEEVNLHPATRPDIYVIVLDGYGRQDVLQDIYHYDNSEFIGQLEKRGFYVAADSHSNYVQTAYSIASLMNFDYVQPWQPSTDYAEYIVGPIQHNRVFELLRKVGYTTVSFEGGTSYTGIQSSDIVDSGFLPLNTFETFLLTNSPFEPLTNIFHLGISIPNYDTHRDRILNHLGTLENVPDSIQGPKITYFHILAPHPPFVFDQDGNPIEPNRPYSILDGNEYAGSVEEYWQGYRQQVIFVNGRILEAIDAILAKSQTPPVILVMGDHGPGSMFRWDPQDPGCTWERTHNFYALLLPAPRNPVTLYPSMTPVNTFRLIFNAYFDTDLPLLDDRTFLVTWQHPAPIIDATSFRDSKNSCVPDDK
ncbi:MAG TPA: hypothetical protein VK909_23800 [Anaerolineales bacterium]|nr:hypothetical protein [Anaerolineales bacterium]